MVKRLDTDTGKPSWSLKFALIFFSFLVFVVDQGMLFGVAFHAALLSHAKFDEPNNNEAFFFLCVSTIIAQLYVLVCFIIALVFVLFFFRRSFNVKKPELWFLRFVSLLLCW